MPFTIGQTVYRKQAEPNEAVVIEVIDNIDIENVYYKLQYIEGDIFGFWPESALFIV